MKLTLIHPDKFFLMWYFLDISKKCKEKHYDQFHEEQESPSIFAPVAKDHMISLVKDKYINIPKLSFNKEHFAFAELNKVLIKIKIPKIKSLILQNNFTYEEFFLIQDELFKVRGNRCLKFDTVPSDLLIKKQFKINPEKISSFLKNYSSEVVNRETITTKNHEVVSLREMADSGELKKVLISQIKDDVIRMYGNISKDIKEIIKREIGGECVLEYLGDINNQFIFLPTIYYMEIISDIKIISVYPDHHYHRVSFYIEKEEDKIKNENKITLIECTKVDKTTNEFTIYINKQYNNGVTLKLSTRYARVLYDIATKGGHDVVTNNKSALGDMRSLNVKRKENPSKLFSTIENLESSKIVIIRSNKIVANNGVTVKIRK